MRSPLLPGLLVTSAAVSAACRGGSSLPRLTSAELNGLPARTPVLVSSRHEITFDAPTNGRNPDDVVIDAQFTTPRGAVVKIGGFPSQGHFKVRYTPREPGVHRWSIRV
ncbi:MAG: glycoside hydrolase, partial [Labilithrix sp.]|nr:glycoside hydrolase [Labilithrix sp.]